MKIIFDCRYTRIERHDGISRFTAGLVTALGRMHPVTMMVSDTRQLAMLPDLPWIVGPSPTSIAEAFSSLVLNRHAPDVVYTPMQTMGPFGRRFRLVTTVHDLIYYTDRTPPRNLAWPIRLLWRLYHVSWVPQRMLLRRADAHVAVSETTKRLMLQHRLTRHPIAVVYNAVDAHPAVVRAAPVARTLVYMGTFMPYKNVDALARAMHELPGYRLQLMSRVAPADRARLGRLAPAGSLEFFDGATDEQYRAALLAASALVSASRNEGFGLPLIEAMAQGTPIVVSDMPIFREVGADAALYFDPTNPASIAARVRELEDPEEWVGRSRSSVERASQFRWDASAARLLELLMATGAQRA